MKAKRKKKVVPIFPLSPFLLLIEKYSWATILAFVVSNHWSAYGLNYALGKAT
jgi:hypothetical protein